jgi:hypothetical protein
MYALYLQTTLYPHRVVLNESKRQLYLIWNDFMLKSCVAHSINCCVNNRRWITI